MNDTVKPLIEQRSIPAYKKGLAAKPRKEGVW